MTPEQKAAKKAAEAAARAAIVASTPAIKSASQLKTLRQLEEMTTAEEEAYLANAEVFVDQFNAKYPDGKAVKAQIKQITLGERVNFVLYPNADLSTTVLSFPYEVVDRIAENAGAGNTDGLVALSHQVLDPLEMTLTVKAVNVGDSYATKQGDKEYKAPATVKIDGSREELQLTDEAKEILAEVHKEVLRANIMTASKSRRKQRGAAVAKEENVPVPAGQEADSEV